MTFNLPIALTWLRIIVIPLFLLLFFLPQQWISIPVRDSSAAIIFILAAVTDWLDGWLARRLQQTSAFGAFLDPVADKLMRSEERRVGKECKAWKSGVREIAMVCLDEVIEGEDSDR